MNSTILKRHVEILRNWNISFQLKKQNTYQNRIDNLAENIIYHEYYMIQFDTHSIPIDNNDSSRKGINKLPKN